MLRNLPLPVRCLPLCTLFLLTAAEPDCTIEVVDGDPPNEGEGEGDEGEGEGCLSDADCRPGAICVFQDPATGQGNEDRAMPCEPDANGNCGDPLPGGTGVCVDIGVGCDTILCAPGFICIEENGQAQCVFDDSDLCFSDFDCQQGERCNLEDFCLTNGDEARPCDNTDPNCGGDIVACQGLCEPIGDGTCSSDSDCDAGFHCELADGTTPGGGNDGGAFCDPNSPDCSNDPAPPPPPEGRCVENQNNGTCSSDADCGDGFHCEFVQTDPGQPFCDPNSPDCSMPPPPPADGICVENNPDECAALCGPGSTCVIFDDGTIGCQPIDPPAECRSDADCVNGGTCNAADVCLSNPSCDANGACTDECWGFCVEPAPTSCISDSDCPSDEICAIDTTCGCPDGSTNCDIPCFVAEGICVHPDSGQP